MSPILERIRNYVCNEQVQNIDNIILQPQNESELMVSTIGSQVKPFDEVITKIEDHNKIQHTIVNQTVSIFRVKHKNEKEVN